MTVDISSRLLRRIIAEAAASPAAEICGLLFGTATRIDAGERTRNVALDRARSFEVDPQSLFAALRAARAGGPAPIGHYHSHPSGAPRPSPRDAAAAAGDGALWLIVAGGEAMLWRAVPGGAIAGAFEPVGLRVIEAGCASRGGSPQGGPPDPSIRSDIA